MNRTYRSIWNASLGAYVAVAETQSSHGRPVSSGRSVRRRAGRALLAPMALEPRIVFDAAIAATVTDVASSAEPVIETADVPESEGAADDAQDSDAEAVAEAPPAAQDEGADEATEVAEAASTTQDDDASQDEVSEAVPTPEEPEVVAGQEALTEGDDAEAAAVAQEPAEPELLADEAQTPAPVGREVVFVDPVTGDLGDYIDRPDAEIVYLDATRDGVEQIAEALREMSDVTAIHIVGHGVEGQLMLGNTVLDAESMLDEHRALLEEIGAALSEDGDILIYGCDFTAGETGLEAARLLSEITGADVAASDDTTGHADKGGDWNLETTIGQVQALALTPTEWVGNLDLVMQTVGTVGDLALAQAIMGPGVVINSAVYTGGSSQAGVFETGAGLSFGSNILEFTDGAVFTTHSDITSVTGTNTAENTTGDATGPNGDPDFVALSPGYASHDASFIVIDFTPEVYPGSSVGDTGRMTASIVFGSEEYNEYVYGGFNDSIGIWVNGVNVALAPNGLSIGIDTINDAATYNPASGSPANDPNPGHDTSGSTFTSANPNLYVNNSTGAYITQMDGFTVTISLTFDVTVGVSNTIKLGIADTGDASYDSWLFVKAESLQTALVAEHDTVTTPSNVPTTVDVTANDFNLSGSELSIVAINGDAVSPGDSVVLASGVTVTLGSGGNVTVEGDGTNAVTDTFTYTVTNVDGQSANAIVSLNITAPTANHAPVAGADSFAAGEGDSAATVGNALGNDSDADGDTITATTLSGVAGSAGGLFSIDASGAVTFDPDGDFEGLAAGETTTTSFTYQISDGEGGSANATVTVTVTGANDAPEVVSANEPADQSGNDGQSITPLDVSGAFSDVDGDTLVYSAVGLPAGLSINPSSGVISGTIAADASQGGPSSDGSYTVTVTVTDPSGATANTVFDYAVANPAPVANADAFAAGENDGAATVGNALGNDSDADGDTITATVQSGVAGSAGGLFSIDASGAVTFDPDGDFEGLAAGETTTTSFTYQISDGEGGSASATVTVTVTGANGAPEVVSGHEPADQSGNDGQSITPLDVSGAFSDVDGDTLVYSAVGLPAGLSINPSSGVISGTIAADASQGGPSSDGSYTVTVTVTDPSGATASTVFDYAVANPAPVAVADSFSAGEEDVAAVVGNALGNDSDADGDTITVTVQSGVAGSNGGLFSIDASGAVTFDPNGAFETLAEGETVTTSFTYQISDGQGGSASATVTVTVTGANDAPLAVDDGPLDVAPGTPVSGNVLGNDSDVEAEPLVVSGFDVDADGDGVAESYQPGQTVVIDDVGTLVIEVNGDFTFRPAPGYAGAVPDVTYHVSDGHDESSAQLSFADVPAVPAPPEPEPTPQPTAPAAPEPTPPAPAPSAPPTERPVSATPAAPEAPAAPPSVTEGSVTPELYVLTTVNSMYAESALASNGLTVAGLDLPFMAEIRSMPREGLMFEDSAESASQVTFVRDGIGMPEPALYVQPAVRHEPITNEHGIYIQRVVRAMQAESRLVDARLRAQANLMSFGDDLLTRTRGLGDGIPTTPDFPAQADESSQPDARSAAPGCDGQAACDARSAAEPEAATPTGEADHAADRQPSTERGLAATLSRKAAPGLRAQLAAWGHERGGRERPLVRSVSRL